MKTDYLLLLFGMGAVTYLPRLAPFMFLSGKKLPPWLIRFLDLIPVAILSALLAPLLFTKGDPRAFTYFNRELVAAFPTLILALKTRSLGGTVVFGMAIYWGLGKIM